MPPPRVNYKDLPKATRDRIDKEHGAKKTTLSKKEREDLRIKQVVENIKDKQRAEEQGTTAKDFREMKKRQDAEKKQPAQKAPSKVDAAKDWLKKRGETIAHETQDLRPRHNPMGNIGMGLPGNSDLFGVGKFGGLHQMMGVDPFNEMRPRSPPPTAIRRKKKPAGKRKAHRRAPAQSGGWTPPTGIPGHMKWMFGQ